MSNSGKEQLSMELAPSNPNWGPSDDASEDSLLKLLAELHTTENRFDILVESMGSAARALNALGATQEQVDAVYRPNPSALKPAKEAIEYSKVETSPPTGPAVDLGERAVHLSAALDGYLKASRSDGLAYMTARSGGDTTAIEDNYKNYRDRANEEFSKAYGAQPMIDGGEPEGRVYKDKTRQSVLFQEEFVGPGSERKSARGKMRRRLKRQIR